jgi:hypothetical protein
MRIYIQSKSGNYNVNATVDADDLQEALSVLRADSGYYVVRRLQGEEAEIFVPFSEIEYIVEASAVTKVSD